MELMGCVTEGGPSPRVRAGSIGSSVSTHLLDYASSKHEKSNPAKTDRKLY